MNETDDFTRVPMPPQLDSVEREIAAQDKADEHGLRYFVQFETNPTRCVAYGTVSEGGAPALGDREKALRQAAPSLNIVEMVADESSFNQPCRFGNLVEGHAVYCHNDAWVDSPRKCRRTWYTGGEVRDEDCPGFETNPAREKP